jgi:hypothetical protein
VVASVVEEVVVVASIVEDMIPDVAEATISTNIARTAQYGWKQQQRSFSKRFITTTLTQTTNEKSAVFVLCAHHSAPKRSPAAVLGPDA